MPAFCGRSRRSGLATDGGPAEKSGRRCVFLGHVLNLGGWPCATGSASALEWLDVLSCCAGQGLSSHQFHGGMAEPVAHLGDTPGHPGGLSEVSDRCAMSPALFARSTLSLGVARRKSFLRNGLRATPMSVTWHVERRVCSTCVPLHATSWGRATGTYCLIPAV